MSLQHLKAALRSVIARHPMVKRLVAEREEARAEAAYLRTQLSAVMAKEPQAAVESAIEPTSRYAIEVFPQNRIPGLKTQL